MRTSQYLLSTLRETPADADVISHQLMLRAGMIRKVASGIYSWLPLGLRVLKKVEKIVREEMDNIGAIEMIMPTVQPAELWQESERWDAYGKELLKFEDRHSRKFCLGPTHEEIITDLMRKELRSYKQVPIALYQIQTKFRDEIRPRFGVMRSREFVMKDAYSFHIEQESLQKTYDDMYRAYTNIFTRLGLEFRPVLADTGSIGGSYSHEFQVLADSGEDTIVYSDSSDYAANIERAESLAPTAPTKTSENKMQTIDTPGLYTIKALDESLQIPATQSVKTLIVKGAEHPMVALILRGDHDLNEIKAENLPQIATPFTFVGDDDIHKAIGARPGSLGPVNLNMPIIADRDAAVLVDFVCGANEDDKHFTHVNWERDAKFDEIVDLRNVVEGDLSPDGKGKLKMRRGIEVGQVFQLGDKYSKSMNATVLDEQGKAVNLIMGCYGVGVTRTVAAAIEQNHDDKGIIWPEPMAPFQVAIIPVAMHKSHRVRELAEKLYAELNELGIEVLFDDRKERPGVLFADMELIGIPQHIIIGERGIDAGTVEVKDRASGNVNHVAIDDVLGEISKTAIAGLTTATP